MTFNHSDAAILTLDIGSSSIRARLFDADALPIPEARAMHKYAFTVEPDGASVFDGRLLRAHVEDCVDAVIAQSVGRAIRAVGMATFVGNVLGVDRDGQPLTPIYTYSDTRAKMDADALAQQVNAQEVHQRTGCRIHTAYLPARLVWLRRTQPELFARVHEWIDFSTYLYRAWLGDAGCSLSVASWSGMIERETGEWDDEWLTTLNLAEKRLPVIAPSHVPQYGLKPDYAERWPGLKDTPFFRALGDGAAANIGSGAVHPNTLALTIGTTAALRIVTNELAVLPDALWSYRLDETRHLIGGATSEGGNLFRWARQMFHLPDAEMLEALLRERPVDGHGLTVLPFWVGERSPGYHADAVGTVHGLRLSTTGVDIVQAMMESIALRLSLIADAIESAYPSHTVRIVRAGGGALAASPAWAQTICNALNRPLALLGEDESTARGIALMVRLWLDGTVLDATVPRIRAELVPQPEAVERLQVARERQRRLYAMFYSVDQ